VEPVALKPLGERKGGQAARCFPMPLFGMVPLAVDGRLPGWTIVLGALTELPSAGSNHGWADMATVSWALSQLCQLNEQFLTCYKVRASFNFNQPWKQTHGWVVDLPNKAGFLGSIIYISTYYPIRNNNSPPCSKSWVPGLQPAAWGKHGWVDLPMSCNAFLGALSSQPC
jgi:hypothetical protein